MNEHKRKIQAAMDELEKSGIWRSNYAPLVFRIQRKMGQDVRPPHYASFWRTVIGYGLWFGGFWGIFMWFGQWRDQGFSFGAAVTASIPAGVLFGLMIASYYVWSGRKHNLSRWDDL